MVWSDSKPLGILCHREIAVSLTLEQFVEEPVAYPVVVGCNILYGVAVNHIRFRKYYGKVCFYNVCIGMLGGIFLSNAVEQRNLSGKSLFPEFNFGRTPYPKEIIFGECVFSGVCSRYEWGAEPAHISVGPLKVFYCECLPGRYHYQFMLLYEVGPSSNLCQYRAAEQEKETVDGGAGRCRCGDGGVGYPEPLFVPLSPQDPYAL